MTLKDSIYKKG